MQRVPQWHYPLAAAAATVPKTAHKCHINRNIKVLISIKIGSIKNMTLSSGCVALNLRSSTNPMSSSSSPHGNIHTRRNDRHDCGCGKRNKSKNKNKIIYDISRESIARRRRRLEIRKVFATFSSFRFFSFLSKTILFVSNIRPWRPDFGTFLRPCLRL